MSIDIISVIETIISLIGAGIILLAIIRGFQIGRALVSGIYRRRAFWISAVGAFAFLSILTGTVPFIFSIVSGTVAFVIFLVLVVVIFTFVDSTILAAMEMDFFHRDTLRWKQFRSPSYAVLFAFVLFILGTSFTDVFGPA
ncbi:MAG: hypothetical protein OK457_07290, partial [Thaumarchaeota archaeon]|nr:hypothetical protein [Nitrososphaerota archaeon]